MKTAASTIALLALFVLGCSDQKKASESDAKDNVLHGQIETMRDAQAVTKQLNEKTQAQDKEAAALAGH
jgi:PBP1b-binding outer membrane lipoprotein LpoB